MLFDCSYKIDISNSIMNKEKAIMLARRMLPEYVFDTAQMENNPITFPEVQTLMDGVTIGGHKIDDVEQVLSIKNAWSFLLKSIKNSTFSVSKDFFHKLNSTIAKNEAIYAGKFRNGSVSIAGTSKYKAPNLDNLDELFDSELPIILDGFSPVDQAIRIFLWGSLNQFYWDGNKRTSRLIANGILLNAGIGVFNIKSKDILEFNTLMIDFYDTKNADKIVKFLSEKSIIKLGE